MPLRIRRGTDADRVANNFTPAQGELIFTTDTKKLYIGDGSTTGGTLVTGEGGGGVGDSTVVATTIGDLTDVNVSGAIAGSVLKYDGGNWIVGTDIDTDTIGGGGATVLSDLTNVNFSNTPQDGWVLKYDLANDEWVADVDDTGLNYPTLVSLTDTDFSNPPQDGWVLKYDLANARWIGAAEVVSSTLTSELDASGFGISDVGTITSTADITTTGDMSATNLTVSTLLTTNQIDATGIIATDIGMKGDILKDDGVTKVLDYVAGEFTGNVTGDVTGDVTGNVTGNANGNHTGTFDGSINATGVFDGAINATGVFDGDVNGSLSGDDSTLLVDGVGNLIVGNVNNIETTTQQVIISAEGIDHNALDITTVTTGSSSGNVSFHAARSSVAAPAVLQAGDSVIDLNTLGWDGSAYTPAAVIKIGADNYTSSIGSGVVPGRILFLTYNEAGTTGLDNALVFNRFGRLGIGTDNPSEKLTVQGNGTFSGFVQFGNLNTTERNALSAANGMVIYNTIDNKFQGYQNGGWINLDDGTAA